MFESLGVLLMQTVEGGERDRALTRRLHLLSKFVTPANLEAPALASGPGASDFFAAVHSLQQCHTVRAPRSKIACFANASRVSRVVACQGWHISDRHSPTHSPFVSR